MEANPFRRTAEEGHFTVGHVNDWKWVVMKVNKLGLYGTSYCRVFSPAKPEGEVGDVYNHEIPNFVAEFTHAVSRLKRDDYAVPVKLPPPDPRAVAEAAGRVEHPKARIQRKLDKLRERMPEFSAVIEDIWKGKDAEVEAALDRLFGK